MPRIPGFAVIRSKRTKVAGGGRGSVGNDGMGHLDELE